MDIYLYILYIFFFQLNQTLKNCLGLYVTLECVFFEVSPIVSISRVLRKLEKVVNEINNLGV